MHLQTREIRMGDHFYEGVWSDYAEPLHSHWKWTLTNSGAICVLALMTTLLACTQGRVWILLRRLVHKWIHRAAAPSGENRRTNPAQGDAVLDLMRLTMMKGRDMIRWPFGRGGVDPPVRSLHSHPVFGAVVLANALALIAMGVAIPYLLSEGGLGSPLVRSTGGPGCRHPGLGTHSIRTWRRIGRGRCCNGSSTHTWTLCCSHAAESG